ncbi:hypothetical protein BU23DRAFT_536618 [Bimuria novae-zelandiae CBS 107.79]|uniref:DUF7730 domain-containing protein n=1 Tax=Bimuria novae-zelandiae CBS 107.79 TaxID=1447943 RepID=A0A6A5V8V4_9PLEO|nr:hypothetical protein BU23DRAFT_536618 [Bimuria novae-zelandiae CBS 107.79]
MKNKKKPSARARSGVATKHKRPGFLGLAGELRNRVYRYYFEPGFKCEFAGKEAQLGTKPRKNVFKMYRNGGIPRNDCNGQKEETAAIPTVRFARVLGSYTRPAGLTTHWSTSLTALPFVCKTIYHETIPLLYATTAFSFDAPARIQAFLTVPKPLYLANVTRLELHYATYGDPIATEHIPFKHKHLTAWNRACKTAAKTLVNLHHLVVCVHVSESRVRLSPYEPWITPLSFFRRRQPPEKSIVKNLATANVRVDTKWSRPDAFSNEALGSAARELHRLFGEAVGRIVLEATVEEAMADFENAWENGYARWQHHLQFARTGW